MRARDRKQAGACDPGLVEVLGRETHIRAIAPKEDVRVAALACDPEHDQPGEPPGIGAHVTDVDTFARELLADEASHVLVADPREHRRPEPEPRETGCEIGR